MAVTLLASQDLAFTGQGDRNLGFPRYYTAFTHCSGVDLKAQVPVILVPLTIDISGNVPSRGDLEPNANFLLNCIAVDQAEQGQGP